MPRKLIDFELDFMIKDIFPRFTVKQFDDVSFNIKPKKQGLDYDTTGMTGKIFIGVNNDMFMQTKNITVSNNNVNILLDRNMLQKNGRAYAEVELTDSNGTITSSSFIFNIDAKIGEGAKIPGEYEGFVAKYERLISEFKAQVNSTIDNCKTNINSTINNCNKAVDNKLNDVDNFVDNKILDIEKRFNALTSSQQQSSEVIDARDGEVSLKARLDRDLYKDGISLSDRIEAIEGLKDSQNMKYETDKGYLVCKETKNGVIDDLKIEGKTLVNKSKVKTKHLISSGNRICEVYAGVSISQFTLVVDVSSLTGTLKSYGFYADNSQEVYSAGVSSNGKWIKYFNFDRPLKSFSLYVDSEEGYEATIDNIIILEGDHTQNPPSYFEGLMSVGQDVDKIEVLSRKEDGNLFDKESIHLNKFLQTNGDETSLEGWFVSDYIKVVDTCYIKGLINNASSNLARICVYDQNKTFKKLLSQLLNTTLNISQYIENGDYIKITEKIEQVDDIIVCKNEISNQIYQSDKKQILFYNENGELEPIQELHEWDSIEKHSDNKWYYHKRSGKIVLNGNEDWLLKQVNTNCTVFALRETQLQNKIKLYPQGVSDKFAWESVLGLSTEVECIGGHSVDVNTIRIVVAKSKLSTQDVTGFKKWLQANNVTVVYQLAQEEVYELAPLHLDSYANETLILCNSGAISPKIEFSITSHINELVKAYGERINLLEEKVYQYMVTQNRMQLASTYSTDSVTFKVDYFSLCGDEENYDEDLYNLILNNILVGKDNYNYDKMFTMILDYASWNQISWEQFDILVGLMDMQHNPPVEEIPTEDEVIEETPNEIM